MYCIGQRDTRLRSRDDPVDGHRWSRYDRMSRHLWPAAQDVVAALPDRPGLLVDVGTGHGSVGSLAAAAGWRVTGVDVSSDQARAAKGNGVTTAIGDAQHLPVRTGTADVLASNFGLIFAPDTAAALQEARRCLKPGGVLVFTTWVPGGWPKAFG